MLDRQQKALAPHFKPGFLQRTHTVFQFFFTDHDPFYLEASANSFALASGTTADATIRLYVESPEILWALMRGELDGMQAFMDGRYKADGNIVLSQLLLYMFKPEDSTLIYEVQD